MQRKKVKAVAYAALVMLWAWLGHHYYTRLAVYAKLKYYITHPVLYVGTEAMWLACVAMITALGVLALEKLSKD